MKELTKMKIVFLLEQSDYSSSFLAEFQRILCRNQNHGLIVVQYDSRKERDVCGKVKKEAPDLLITTNLWGFEQCTLTDNLALNLLNCKQIHLLLHKNNVNEIRLKNQLSISMFFYCLEADYDYFSQNHFNLPYLKTMDGWLVGDSLNAKKTNAEILYSIVCEVLKECGISH